MQAKRLRVVFFEYVRLFSIVVDSIWKTAGRVVLLLKKRILICICKEIGLIVHLDSVLFFHP